MSVNLNDFLYFNNFCPMCGEPLSLYMQAVGSICFKGLYVSDKCIKFEPFKGTSDDKLKQEYVKLYTLQSNTFIECSSEDMYRALIEDDIYFFFLCNPKAFKDIGHDYEIKLYYGCYYRMSPLMQIKELENRKILELSNPDDNKLINKNESFSFNKTLPETDKVYMMNLDYANDKTILWHYTIPSDQKSNTKFRPNVFEKTLPLLKTRPLLELSNRQKLIDRMDGWIIMS